MNRVEFNFDYIEHPFSFEWLQKIVLLHSNEYYTKHLSVKAIVEFVSKNSAQKCFEGIIKNSDFEEFEVILLTGTILDHRRKEIVEKIKNNSFDSKKIILITTQVIEAGVDIDMDIGFKDKSIIDSEEQFAGRINRNAKKTDSVLYIFNSKDSLKVYRSDIRLSKACTDLSFYKQTIKEKSFDCFYDKIFDSINENNSNELMANNLTEFLDYISSLNFKEASKRFKLIDNNTFSIFVPISINAKYFSKDDLGFLSMYSYINSQESIISGREIWQLYESVLLAKSEEFIDRAAKLKAISSLLYKFTFSTYSNPHTMNLFAHYGEFKYGFFYLSNYENIYSFENGLKDDIETDCNFL